MAKLAKTAPLRRETRCRSRPSETAQPTRSYPFWEAAMQAWLHDRRGSQQDLVVDGCPARAGRSAARVSLGRSIGLLVEVLVAFALAGAVLAVVNHAEVVAL